MTSEIYQLLLALIAGGVLGNLVTYFTERRKKDAERESIITEAAQRMINELQEERTDQVTRFRTYRDEAEYQYNAYRQEAELKISNLVRKVNDQETYYQETALLLAKYQVAFKIIVRQLKMVTSFEPLIEPDKIDEMKLDDLRDIERSMSYVEHRRKEQSDIRTGGGDYGEV
jgi:hypothetical protein